MSADEKDVIEKSKKFTVAGRVETIRAHGGVYFIDLIDESLNSQSPPGAALQLALFSKLCGTDVFDRMKRSIRAHDIVCALGLAGCTRSGARSLIVLDIELLTPCLLPVPLALRDPELRFRNRPLDLVVNRTGIECGSAPNRGGISAIFVRDIIVATIERFWNERGLLRIESPILDYVASGAAARPFLTHHHALDVELSMRVATELALKKAIVAGALGGAFEVGKQFRNEDMDQTHNPEFTSCEAYWPYHDYEDLMVATEELVARCIEAVKPPNYDAMAQTIVVPRGHLPGGKMGEVTVSMKRPWCRINVVDELYAKIRASKKYAGPLPTDEQLIEARFNDTSAARQLLDDACVATNVVCDLPRNVERLFDKLVGEFVEPDLRNPTFVCCHPRFACPLAKWHRTRPALTERFELFVAGTEAVNAYTELNHPEVQRYEFSRQARQQKSGDLEAQSIDEGFCQALELGLPPTAGWGIGIDRLVMLLCGVSNIRDAMLFSLMRPDARPVGASTVARPPPLPDSRNKKKVVIVGAGMMTGFIVDQLLRRDAARTVRLMAQAIDKKAQQVISGSGGRATYSEIDVLAIGAVEAIAKEASGASIVLSMVPPKLHWAVASACVAARTNMITSSYGKNVASFDDIARERDITILTECGLDPGIDHAFAARIKEASRMQGTRITEFRSFCGGVPHPDCASSAPLSYRISWNPGAVLRVLSNQGIYVQGGQAVVAMPCIAREHVVTETVAGTLYEVYPNRDSRVYMADYGMDTVPLFIRGTLRHLGFCEHARSLMAAGLLDDTHKLDKVLHGDEDTIEAALRCVIRGKMLGNDASLIDPESWSAAGFGAAYSDCVKMGIVGNGSLPPHHVPVHDLAQLTPLECTAELLNAVAQYGPGMKDRVILTVSARHESANGHEKFLATESLVLDGDPVDGFSAMSMCVGSAAVAGIEMIESGEVTQRGCICPRSINFAEYFLARIKTMGVTGFSSSRICTHKSNC
jgi:lysyl-tRNA synthetase class 2